jgi:ribosomal protein S18 acetylase RimI-like enzyme
MTTSIRPGKEEDAVAISDLLGQLGYPSSPDAVRRRLARLRQQEALVYVAESERVVGMIAANVIPTIERDELVARIAALVVDEEFRSLGIGEQLVERLAAEARNRGCSLVYVTSANSRERAHSFYQRFGMEQTGLRFVRRLRPGLGDQA